MATSKKLFVSAAAREVGCSALTLVNYELKSIVVPVRDHANRRLYSKADIKAARKYYTGTYEQKTAIRERRRRK